MELRWTQEFIHSRLVMAAAAAAAATEAKFEDQEANPIEMESIPDGLEPGDDRKDIKKAWWIHFAWSFGEIG